MFDAANKILYVGKAKNLKKRVSSYFHRQLDNKTLQLVKQIESIEVTVTRNEREALLLESNLIKELTPRYNVIFKDDKSYPYLALTAKEPFPRLYYHRGTREKKVKYFGPYPNARAAREALTFLQGLFKLRQCDDGFFKTRKRPCLQYQIKRCTAPCVGFITEEVYQKDAEKVLWFLEGKSQAVIDALIAQMEEASQNQDYEKAARHRDQIANLRPIQNQQIIMKGEKEADVLGVYLQNGNVCIHMLVIREGRMLGSRPYFPNQRAVLFEEENVEGEILETFILQHYSHHNGEFDKDFMPREIIVSAKLPDLDTVESILSELAGKEVTIRHSTRGLGSDWLEMAKESAKQALVNRLRFEVNLSAQFEMLQEALKLEAVPTRIECFDVSHSQGEATVASCVVFDVNGPVKSDYRRFNIRDITPGDDYGALKEALTRRYTRLKSEGGNLPDLLFIDGGKGQLKVAESVLRELQVAGVTTLSIAKGRQRKPGLETLFVTSKGEELDLPPDSKAFHLIQQIRDEAHRFAITAHRAQRAKKRVHSRLEDIPGVGKSRRVALLKQFGGLQEVMRASEADLAKVPGISQNLAKRIYEALHGS